MTLSPQQIRALYGSGAAVLAVAAGFALAPGAARAQSLTTPLEPAVDCATLAARALPNAKITTAQAVAAGAFTPPGAGPGGQGRPVPVAFCRVAVTLTPSSDSDIKSEVWLPRVWNGKFMMVGNGGWSGSITYNAMVEPLTRGYAVASTDTGHEGQRGTFALGHPEKLIDFAYRAVHETAVKGKALTAAFYGKDPRFSYWNGCSSGGKQGLKEIQMYPGDFDGAIVGAPANNWIRLQTQSLAANIVNLPKAGGGKAVLEPAQFAILNKGALDQCDDLDGLKDRQILDPRVCNFKATSLVCKPGQAAAECLTPAQADAADRIYAPVKNPRTGALIYPGMPPGSEMTWGPVISRPWDTGADTYRVLFKNPNWDFYTMDLAKDVEAAEAADPGLMATSPDLSAFKARGGKIIQYHGWADPFIPTENSINYYESVVAKQGSLAATQDFHRLFLVPAMAHCGGAYTWDLISALEHWREGSVAPDLINAHRVPPPGYTPPPALQVVQAPQYGDRPICAYPAIAARTGGGSGEEPVNYTCQAGKRGARPDHAVKPAGARIASR
jgi:feruloyl esterase